MCFCFSKLVKDCCSAGTSGARFPQTFEVKETRATAACLGTGSIPFLQRFSLSPPRSPDAINRVSTRAGEGALTPNPSPIRGQGLGVRGITKMGDPWVHPYYSNSKWILDIIVLGGTQGSRGVCEMIGTDLKIGHARTPLLLRSNAYARSHSDLGTLAAMPPTCAGVAGAGTRHALCAAPQSAGVASRCQMSAGGGVRWCRVVPVFDRRDWAFHKSFAITMPPNIISEIKGVGA